MRFSVSLPTVRSPGQADPYRETFELARIAEEEGFDTVTVGHHHFMPGNQSDPLTFMAAVAARTSTLRVGTGIFLLPAHNPIRVAEQVATIDQISGGRISLGVGSGWWPLEYDVQGSNFHERGARMEEALSILRQVWTQEDTSWDGPFWSFPKLTVHPRPVQSPHPPSLGRGGRGTRGRPRGETWRCMALRSSAVIGQGPKLSRNLSRILCGSFSAGRLDFAALCMDWDRP